MRIEINSVCKNYLLKKKELKVLDDINLDIASSEFICILGPSGCGKSTLLDLIGGFGIPSSGSILADGIKILGPSADRALMFQEAALFPWMNVLENVAFGLEAAGVSRKERTSIAQRFIKLTHLEGFEKAHPHELSGGMKQRAALARALSINPKVMLMDEPFGALDAQTRDILHEELQVLWSATKKTIIFVTHNVREALILGDRVLLMSPRPGRIMSEFAFDIPRPRHFEDPGIAEAARVILKDLRDVVHASEPKGRPHGPKMD